MLTLSDADSQRSRRSFLQAGALGLGSLTLADVLRLRAAEKATGAPRKAVIWR